MEDRQERTYNILIGKGKDGEFYFLEHAFKHGEKGLRGLTGNSFEFHTKDEADRALDDYIDGDGLLDLWKEGVYHGNITQSYEDWKEDVRDEDGYGTIYDYSYQTKSWLSKGVEIAREKDEIDYDEDCTDCRGGGRCFNRDMLYSTFREWTVEDNYKLFKDLYMEYEIPNDEENDIREAKERLKELTLTGIFKEEQVDAWTKKILIPENALDFLIRYKKQYSEWKAKDLIKKMEEEWEKQKN